MKEVLHVLPAPQVHWVGDGFRVHSMFSYESLGQLLSPFLLLDYGSPHHFAPTSSQKGVGSHPHRGFETVTIAFEGEVSHLDSSGGGGTIGPGDVQWMTAGRGIVHQEFHSEAFARQGGIMHMVQLWVNLPAQYKMMAPGYQALLSQDIPNVALPDQAGMVRLIAGSYGDSKGPAVTQTPMWVWDLTLQAGKQFVVPVPLGWSTAVVVMSGQIRVNQISEASRAQLVVMSQSGEALRLEASTDAHLLLLAGQPIQEPIVGYGPFVMNTREEIVAAVEDFKNGQFGVLDVA